MLYACIHQVLLCLDLRLISQPTLCLITRWSISVDFCSILKQISRRVLHHIQCVCFVCVCVCVCVHTHVGMQPWNLEINGSSWWVTENSWQYPACWTSSDNHDLLRGDRLLHGDVVLVGGHGTCRLRRPLHVAPLGWRVVAFLGGCWRDGTIPLLWLVHCNVHKKENDMVWLTIKGNN